MSWVSGFGQGPVSKRCKERQKVDRLHKDGRTAFWGWTFAPSSGPPVLICAAEDMLPGEVCTHVFVCMKVSVSVCVSVHVCAVCVQVCFHMSLSICLFISVSMCLCLSLSEFKSTRVHLWVCASLWCAGGKGQDLAAWSPEQSPGAHGAQLGLGEAGRGGWGWGWVRQRQKKQSRNRSWNPPPAAALPRTGST
jgi:hypothetical protein